MRASSCSRCVVSHAGVWIETAIPSCIAESGWVSCPTRASRLKRQHLAGQDMGGGAGLLWVRGLKRKTRNGGLGRPTSCLKRSCELKHGREAGRGQTGLVALHVGPWIETGSPGWPNCACVVESNADVRIETHDVFHNTSYGKFLALQRGSLD